MIEVWLFRVPTVLSQNKYYGCAPVNGNDWVMIIIVEAGIEFYVYAGYHRGVWR